MPSILSSIIDRKLKTKYAGDVFLFTSEGKERVAIVYGKTLNEMKMRKHEIVFALMKIYNDPK